MDNNDQYIDKPIKIRDTNSLNTKQLLDYLVKYFPEIKNGFKIEQFPGGYSNLTYLLKWNEGCCVLRKPPLGANIKSAHDMGREFKVLSLLKPIYNTAPKALLFCNDENIIGAPFYLMEKVNGIILRNKVPNGLTLSSSLMKSISISAINNLASLHNLDIVASELIQLGKPEGYVQRQVAGWIKRYQNAATDEVLDMNKTADWMMENIPSKTFTSFIHNDYKYDNLILNPNSITEIKAVLDWEMATIGDSLMDLGTTLAYWAEANDSDALKPFNLTWLDGNLTRDQVVEQYAVTRNISLPSMLFYYVFGSYKIAVIVQQIYARYKKGLTTDKRFASLMYVLKACAHNAQQAIQYQRISNFY